MIRDLLPGTRVALHVPLMGLAQGTWGVVTGGTGSVYNVDFAGVVRAVNRVHLKVAPADAEPTVTAHEDLRPFVQYACVMGSRAFGLGTAASDTDVRGFYLPPARLHWGLAGVPEQLESESPGREDVYWEAGKFVRLALRANPNVLEVLASPLPLTVTPVAAALLDIRGAFLSRLIVTTYGEYVRAQLRRLENARRTHGEARPKHLVHLLRLLISGAHALRTGEVLVDVTPHRDALLAIKRGETTWAEADAWRQALLAEFEHAAERTRLPERPDAARVEAWLLDARRAALDW